MMTIKPKSIFVPREKGCVYPDDAVVVDSCDIGETVYFHSIGGGWNKRASWAEFKLAFRPVSDEEIENVSYREGLFTVDEYFDPPLKGYTKGHLWNGWATPSFEKPEILQMGTVFGDVKFDEATDTVTCDHGETVDPDCRYESAKGKDIVVNGEVKHVYSLGAGAWCWDEVTDDE